MSKLVFKRSQIEELATFCKENNTKNFFLTNDNGVYIGATAGKQEDSTFRNCIQYLEGCDPSQNEDQYGCYDDNSRILCGSDDFGEHIEASLLLNLTKDSSWTKFIINLTKTQFSIAVS